MANPAGAAGDPAAGEENQTYLSPAFYFRVDFLSRSAPFDSASPPDNSFMEVSGISSEMETDPYNEGGENRFTYQLPKGTKFQKLSLKRGIADMDSPLVTWCRDILEGGYIDTITPMDLSVSLLNENGDPVRSWTFVNAYPVKWEVEGFNSTKNELAIEKIDLNYNYSNRTV